MELPEHMKPSIWNPTLTIERQKQAWPIQHTATRSSMLSKYDNDPETSGDVRPLHRACSVSTVTPPPGHSLVILNGAQLRANISQGLQVLPSVRELLLYYWHKRGQSRPRGLLFTATINSRPHHCHNGDLSGEDGDDCSSEPTQCPLGRGQRPASRSQWTAVERSRRTRAGHHSKSFDPVPISIPQFRYRFLTILFFRYHRF